MHVPFVFIWWIMREQLRKYYGQRLRFTATVDRFGKKKGYKGRTLITILLENVIHSGEEVTDHLWMTAGKWSKYLEEGDTFSFNARVMQYLKGYRWHDDDNPMEIDFRLVRPTVIEVINTNQGELI